MSPELWGGGMDCDWGRVAASQCNWHDFPAAFRVSTLSHIIFHCAHWFLFDLAGLAAGCEFGSPHSTVPPLRGAKGSPNSDISACQENITKSQGNKKGDKIFSSAQTKKVFFFFLHLSSMEVGSPFQLESLLAFQTTFSLSNPI